MFSTSRNSPEVFAQRTLRNLEHIEQASALGEDVHVVTQMAGSLLGLIVFPQERTFSERIKALRLHDLERQGWPRWHISKDTSQSLGDIVRHLRNAVAHGRMRFSSDSPDINEVVIEVEDHRKNRETKEWEPYWCAHIPAPALREFCARFVGLLVNAAG